MIERILLWLSTELPYQLRLLYDMPTAVVVMLWIIGVCVTALGGIVLYAVLFEAPWWVSAIILFCLVPPLAFKYYCGGSDEV